LATPDQARDPAYQERQIDLCKRATEKLLALYAVKGAQMVDAQIEYDKLVTLSEQQRRDDDLERRLRLARELVVKYQRRLRQIDGGLKLAMRTLEAWHDMKVCTDYRVENPVPTRPFQ